MNPGIEMEAVMEILEKTLAENQKISKKEKS